MLLHVKDVMTPAEVAQVRALVDAAPWVDGRTTAGMQATLVKNNRQVPEDHPSGAAAREIVLAALRRSALFFSAALPKRFVPPKFNRYADDANTYGDHVDNSVHAVGGAHVRTDVSATLFLTDPDDYDGGELVVEDAFGSHRVKLPAGDLVLYPASSVHRVEPVTRGARVSSFLWVESMVRSTEQRRVLFDLDMAILELRATVGESAPVVSLTGTYHNLLRLWAET